MSAARFAGRYALGKNLPAVSTKKSFTFSRVDTGELHVVVGLLPHFCKHFSDERRAARWPADQHKTPRSRHSYPFGWWPVAGQQ